MAKVTAGIAATFVVMYGRAMDSVAELFFANSLGYPTVAAAAAADLTLAQEVALANQFGTSQSAYFTAQYGALSGVDFINALYNNLGGQNGDNQGLIDWQVRLTQLGGNTLAAKMQLAGEFTFAFLNFQVTNPSDPVQQQGAARQQVFLNKVDVSLAYAAATSTSLVPANTTDAAFLAAQAAVANVFDATSRDAQIAKIQTANAANNPALITPAPVGSSGGNVSFTPTIGETITGTASNDVFNGNLFFNAPSGTFIQTVQTGDSANGLGGTDLVNIGATGAVTLTSFTNIEQMSVMPAGALFLNMINSDGSVNNIAVHDDGGFATTIFNLNSVPGTLSLTNATGAFTLAPTAALVAGTSDTGALTVNNVTGAPVVTLAGYDIVNVTSAGAVTNLFALGGGAVTETFTGARAATVVSGNPATTVDASGMTAAFDYTVGGAAITQTITGGSANDIFRMLGTFTSADVVNGGGGTNILNGTYAPFAAITSADANVTNISTLQIADDPALAAASTLRADLIGTGINTVSLLAGQTGAFALTIRMNAGTDTVNVTGGVAGVLNVEANGASTADALTLNLGAGATLGGGLNVNSGGRPFETVTINTVAGGGTVAAVAMNATPGILDTVNVTGVGPLTLGPVTADVLNASTMGAGGSVFMAAASTNQMLITGSPGTDQLVGSAFNDTINSTGGNDVIFGIGGVDGIVLNAGFENVNFFSEAPGGLALSSVNFTTVTPFTVGATRATSDEIGITAGFGFNAGGTNAAEALEFFDGTTDLVAGSVVSATSMAQNQILAAVATNNFLKLTTGVAAGASAAATFGTAIGGGTITMGADGAYLGSFYDTTNSRAVIFTVDSAESAAADAVVSAADAASITVIAMLGMSAADYANFGNNQVVFI